MSFSPLALQHIQNPRGSGPIDGATHVGQAGDPGGGPYVKFWLVVEGARIVRASWDCNGCPAAVASSSIAAYLLVGRTVEQALSVTPEDLTLIVGELPAGYADRPQMAVRAIHNTLEGVGKP